MATATFILGLCGSGKSWLAERLHDSTGAEVFDEPIGRETQPAIVQCLGDGRDCIIEELFYCVPGYRDAMVALLEAVPNVVIKFICYENDLDAANANVRRRTNKGRVEQHLRLNTHVSPLYTLPDGCERRPIFRIGE